MKILWKYFVSDPKNNKWFLAIPFPKTKKPQHQKKNKTQKPNPPKPSGRKKKIKFTPIPIPRNNCCVFSVHPSFQIILHTFIEMDPYSVYVNEITPCVLFCDAPFRLTICHERLSISVRADPTPAPASFLMAVYYSVIKIQRLHSKLPTHQHVAASAKKESFKKKKKNHSQCVPNNRFRSLPSILSE